MTSSSSHILGSSLSGSVELLTLCFAGAYLVHSAILDRKLTRRLSKACKDMFIPCLVFGSILHTARSAIHTLLSKNDSFSALQEIWVPVFLAFMVLGISAVFAIPITRLVAFDKQEAVRRAIFVCLALGNANVLPLLVMQSLCDTFPPLMEVPHCYERSMGYASLFLTIINIISWTTLYQYLRASRDNVVDRPAAEEAPLVAENCCTPEDEADGLKESISRALKSPIFMSMIAAVFLAFISPVANALLNHDGALRPVMLSINILGNVVVPVNAIVVGAEFYLSMVEDDNREYDYQEDEMFGNRVFAVILIWRLIVLPALARFIYSSLGLASQVHNHLLGIFGLIEFNNPTANTTVMMMSLVRNRLKRAGRQLGRDVVRTVFIQFLCTPIFLTINTAAALQLQYSGRS